MSVDSRNLSKLLGSAALVFVGTLFGAFATLLERVIVGRFLTRGAYGEFSIGLAIMTLGSMVALIGFTQGVPRYMARFDAREDVRGTWVTGLVVAGTAAVLLSVVLLAARGVVAPRLLDESLDTHLYELFVLTIPFFVALKVGVGAIRGLENTRFKTYTRDLLYPVLRIGTLVVLLWLGFDIVAAGYSYLFAAIVAAVSAHLLLDRLLPLRGPATLHVRQLLVFSTPLMVSTVMSMLLTRTDTLMLGYFRPSAEVGIYNAAFPLASALIFVLGAFGYLYLPLTSRLDGNDEREEVERVYELTTKWIFVVTFPAFAVLVAFPTDVIAATFGAKYAVDAFVLPVIAIGFFTNAAAGRNRETLTALGFPRTILALNGIAFAVNFLLNFVLIPTYSYRGAAVASATSYVLLNVLGLAVLNNRAAITPFNSSTVRTFLALPLLVLPPCLLLSREMSLSLLTIPPFVVAVGLVSLVVVGLVGGVEPEDLVVIEFLEEKTGLTIPYVRRIL